MTSDLWSVSTAEGLYRPEADERLLAQSDCIRWPEGLTLLSVERLQ